MVFSIVAEAYGLPMLSAYLDLTKGQDIRHGVNFAFAGGCTWYELFQTK